MILESFQRFIPILILLTVVVLVMVRIPKVDLGHSTDFVRRRIANWLPLGLTYSFLYMGRYNLTVSKNAFGDQVSNADFGQIFGVGTLVYGFSFILNGPLTDRFGGRRAILIAAVGSAVANFLMGLVVQFGSPDQLITSFSILYAVNMYFQSFGAVAIVKVNSSWFHVRERGMFGGIFGILISLGIYFAFDWGGIIAKSFPLPWVFYIPTLLLITFFMISFLLVCDRPSDAGFDDFDTGDAILHTGEGRLPLATVARKMFSNPVIITIALIEFCSGFLRNAIMHWYIIFSKQTGIMSTFVPSNWGLLLCCAGILGGVFAGTISDKLFESRRGPVSAFLYGIILVCGIVSVFLLNSPWLGWVVVFSSMAVIGVHGMLSGTASMDFGGRQNVGTAVGIIDGMVYLGTAAQSVYYGWVLPNGDAAKDPNQWLAWPIGMIPVAGVGLILASRLWNAKPR